MSTIKNRHTGEVICEFSKELVGADLSGANLSRADLYRADLYRADLSRADLYRADLSGANLYGANLYGANLRGANLSGANLYGANLYGADLYGANLCEANLCRANLYGAIVDGETLKKNPIHVPCGLGHIALITDGYMRLGCTRYTHAQWGGFSDDEIRAMDVNALEFWKVWKAPLLAMCKAHAEECTREKS